MTSKQTQQLSHVWAHPYPETSLLAGHSSVDVWYQILLTLVLTCQLIHISSLLWWQSLWYKCCGSNYRGKIMVVVAVVEILVLFSVVVSVTVASVVVVTIVVATNWPQLLCAAAALQMLVPVVLQHGLQCCITRTLPTWKLNFRKFKSKHCTSVQES